MKRKAQTVFVFAALLLAVRLHAEWLEVRSLHFTITTNNDESVARQALYELEQLRTVLPPNRPDVALEIYLLRDVSTVQHYAGNEHTAGFLSHGEDHDRAVAVASGRRELLHEYVHYAMMKDTAESRWITEGVAQYYSMTQLSGDRFTIGVRDQPAVAFLRTVKLAPVDELAKADPEVFYAEAWALVHLLMSEHADLRTDVAGLDARLAAHIQQGAPGGERQYARAAYDIAKFQARPLAEAEASLRLVQLLPEAERTAALAAIVERDPDCARAWEMLGTRHFAAGLFDDSLAAYRRAIDLGSERAETWYLAGLIERHYLQDEDTAERRLYRASALDPSNADYRMAWQGVAESRADRDDRVLRVRAFSVHDALTFALPAPRVELVTVAKAARLTRKAAPPTRAWVFPGVKLVGCSGPPGQQVCTYSR